MTSRQINILLIILLSSFVATYGQENNLKLADFKHRSIWIYKSEKSQTTYCMTGVGFQMADPPAKTDSIIDSWISKHPNSKMLPIYSMKNKSSSIVYCWVIDSGDTLNLYLVKNGVFPEHEMHRIQTWDELSDMQKTYNEPKKEHDKKMKVLIDSISYSTFLTQLKIAQAYARQNKLGIWSTK
jgi:hypothetical protein